MNLTDLKERMDALHRTAPARQVPNLYGSTPLYRLRPRVIEEMRPVSKIPIVIREES